MVSIKLNSGYEIPLLGLGTWQGVDVEEAVVHAIEAGYRHIDCSPIYGNEADIGKALKAVLDKKIVKREELFIVSKLWCHKHRKEDVKPALKQTLRDLQLDYLDLYHVHWPICFKSGDNPLPMNEKGDIIYDDVPHVETWKGMEECVREGLTRSIGLSNFNKAQIQNVLNHCTIKPAMIQVEIYPYFQNQKLVDFCHSNGITVTGYGSLGSPARPWSDGKIVLENDVILKLAQKYKKTAAQIILRWLVQRNICTIPKSSNPKRLKDNINIFDFNLAKEDFEEIKKIDRNERLFDVKIKADGVTMIRDENVPHYPFLAEF